VRLARALVTGLRHGGGGVVLNELLALEPYRQPDDVRALDAAGDDRGLAQLRRRSKITISGLARASVSLTVAPEELVAMVVLLSTAPRSG
jgi:hypothetical protein